MPPILPMAATMQSRKDSLFRPVEKGWQWGGEGSYCWFKGEFTIPDALAGQDLFAPALRGV